MKRFAPLALIVLALALIPAAFADGSPAPTSPTTATSTTATTPAAPAATPNGGGGVRMRVEFLRLRLQIIRLRFELHCGKNGNASHDRCMTVAQNVLDRLTKLDQNVQQKIADLKSCAPDSTDSKCKNADKKIALLTRIDTHLQKAIAAIQNWLNGGAPTTTTTTTTTSSTSSSSDGALDQAAAGLSQAADGSNG